MSLRPWNVKVENRAFWDPNHNDGLGAELPKVQTVKEALTNFSGMKHEDMLRTLAQGLAMVMEEIDKEDYFFHRHQK